MPYHDCNSGFVLKYVLVTYREYFESKAGLWGPLPDSYLNSGG